MGRRFVLLLIGAIPGGALWPAGADSSADAGGSPSVPAQRGDAGAAPRFLGAGSCSAAACHGGSGRSGTWLSEHTTWIAHDPHARAYEVLWSERSVRMARHLGIKSAHEKRLCLNCHVRPDFNDSSQGPRFRKEDGVGCESCHGPAERWLQPHYQDGWRLKTLAQKGELGMRDTKSLVGRAEVCVRCHVGGAGADVTHDLIAAGHPPLRFEFAAFHANLPRHWNDAKDLTPSGKAAAIDPRGWPDFEARAWLIGQVVSAQTALELLAHRATRSERSWPELAAFDCFACHHRLEAPSWRQRRADPGRTPGSLAWNEWYFAMTPRLSEANPAVAALLLELKRSLERPGASHSALPKAATEAARALRALRSTIEKRLDQKLPHQELARAVLAAQERLWTWDRAAQSYLGLEALHRAGKASKRWDADPRWDAALTQFGEQLRSPERFDPFAVAEKLGELRALLKP